MIRDQLIGALAGALAAAGIEVTPADIEIERPARREHGDWSSNVALASARANGRNPRELAQDVADQLSSAPPPHVESVEVAGPGFVNFRLADSWLHEVLASTIAAGVDSFGRHTFGMGTRVNVEFVSANPNKPLHAGHARGAVYGDSVARLLEAVGHEVVRETYINDRGVQMTLFAESLAARQQGLEPPDEGYQGEYVADWASEMPVGADPLEWGYARALSSHRETLSRVNVDHDVWFSERSLVDGGAVQETLEALVASGCVYESEGATWLRTTEFGDDKDRVLIKSDGDYTYLTPDIAYHRDKFKRADRLVDVWGADHHGYITRMKAALSILGHDPDDFEVIVTQLVDLLRAGAEVAMSGRLGDMVSFDEIIDEVGPDAARFTFLMQSMDTRQTVDLAELAKRSMDNPVHYVQYVSARIHQLVANAVAAGFQREPLDDVDLSRLEDARELDVLRSLSEYPEIVAIAARERAPHKIITWLRELARAFHAFYQSCYVVGDGVDAELTQARLWLIEAARIGVTSGLDLAGVSAPQEM